MGGMPLIGVAGHGMFNKPVRDAYEDDATFEKAKAQYAEYLAEVEASRAAYKAEAAAEKDAETARMLDLIQKGTALMKDVMPNNQPETCDTVNTWLANAEAFKALDDNKHATACLDIARSELAYHLTAQPDDGIDFHGATLTPRHLLGSAFGLIMNAYGGDWDKAHADWRTSAQSWREAYDAFSKAFYPEGK